MKARSEPVGVTDVATFIGSTPVDKGGRALLAVVHYLSTRLRRVVAYAPATRMYSEAHA